MDTPAPPQGASGTAAWLRAGLLRVQGPDPRDEDDGDHELARVSAAAAGLLLRKWATGDGFAGAQAALAAWVRLHIAAHLRRGAPNSWQWGLATTAWVMEQCGIVDLVRANRQEAHAHVASLGIKAAATRSLPFSGWWTGRATAVPGASIPGMTCRKPGFFADSGAQRGGDAERALARAVEILAERAAAAGGGRNAP